MPKSSQSIQQAFSTRDSATGTQVEPGSDALQSPAVSLPKGGGAIHGIGEKFAANPVTGTGSLSVPIVTSPGRAGFGPQLALAYDSGAGNGPFGFGWNLSLPAITRKTDKGLPQYRDGHGDASDSDVFILSGAEDLVPMLSPNGTILEQPRDGYWVRQYCPRIEGLFARIERWTNQADSTDVFWRSISKENITTLYGKTQESRVADPSDASRIFSWLVCQSYDDKGNAIVYGYVAENDQNIDLIRANERNRVRTANCYLKHIAYGNRTPNRDANGTATDPTVLPADTWMFEVVFDYGEGHVEILPSSVDEQQFVSATRTVPTSPGWPARQDAFSSYRAGFEVRTYRLCQRVLMFHHFPVELGVADYLIRSTEFTYAAGPVASFITDITQVGYKYQPNQDDANRYLRAALPSLVLTYSQVPSAQELATRPIQQVDAESLENLPVGLDGAAYQWIDLDGDGVAGILTEQADGWFYKRNLSPLPRAVGADTSARFAPLERVATRPAGGLRGGQAQFMDLAGDGQPDLVLLDGSVHGFFERTSDENWEPFRAFRSWPTLNPRDPNLRFVDLDGDGHADILVSEHDVFTWYPSLAEDGFGPVQRTPQFWNEERGPRVVFADGTQSIYLADLSGDGLTDLVRIRNGEICYWPNLGYGRFGAKVTMDNAPWFDAPEQFEQDHIRLADIDGSGVTDIIYLHRNGARLYYNQSGNAWSAGQTLDTFPPIDNLASVQALDLLGNGTACLVWSSPLPGNAGHQMRYLDLMGQKPHLLIETANNLGAETVVQYAPSTRFYLQDKRDGTPWLTKLPFPVHVVERVETYDRVSRNRFVTRYTYHHGYFDGVEREFRGFGLVEQWDTEEIGSIPADQSASTATNLDAASFVPPIYTKTWFHTGIYRDEQAISQHLAAEYYDAPDERDITAFAAFLATLLPDTLLPDGLTLDEQREACRALRGVMLRQEVYGLDGSDRTRHPYTVTEQNFAIELVQPQGANQHGVFFTHTREALSYHYERNPSDPRIGHTLTLEVNTYGSVLKSVAIGYGRTQSPLAEQPDRARQMDTLITYAESSDTNPIDDAAHPDDYRTPLPAESRTYELTGYTPAPGGARFQIADFVAPDPSDATHRKQIHLFDSELAYEETTSVGRQRRLIEQVRTQYRTNDLTALAPLGVVESLALPGETYKLALTPGLLAQVFQRGGEALLPAGVLESQGADGGGYVAIDGNWWIPSGRSFFSATATAPAAELAEARQHFLTPKKFIDPFGHSSTATYDANDLLVVKTEDALGNTVSALHDYRVLQPRQVTDPNGNRSEVHFDALGMVVGTAVMGKATGPTEGDSFANFAADLTPQQIAEYFDTADPHTLAGTYLGSATTRIIYDLDRVPACAASIARETHESDLAPGTQTQVQLSFSYSDGFGREVQKKMQAEPGPVPQRDTNGAIIVGPNGQPEMTATDISPRWVGSGWTIFNNKGKPIRQFEPFFSDTYQLDSDARIGVSSTLFYDPAERVVATLHPNHSWEKVVFDPWQQTTYDVNDTVLNADGSTDPKADPDVQGFFTRLPDADYLPTWYEQRHALAPTDPERIAAEQAAVHRQTPTMAHFDTLGRPFLTIAQNRFEQNGGIVEEQYATRVELDIENNQRVVRDAKDRTVMRYDYDILGSRIHQASMEAGERWTLNDVMGKPIRAWDSRGFARRMTYDELRRPIGLFVSENSSERLAERTVYGENQGDAANHRGRAFQVFDGAGVVTSAAYDFKGNLLRGTRDLLPNYKQTVDWQLNPVANDGSYATSTSFDALNRPITVTSPDNSVYRPTFNQANLLDKVDVQLRGAAVSTAFVANIDYDAKGQRTLIVYGNGTRTSYEYDPLSLRLIQLRSTRPAGSTGLASQLFTDPAIVQDLRYTYDPVGNITRIADAALQTIFFNNQQVEPVCTYKYDAIYRLIEANGREQIGQTAHDFNPQSGNRRDFDFAGLANFIANPNDMQAMRGYTERYEYDAVGNFQFVRHAADGGSWTRSYEYSATSLLEPAEQNNRLTRTTVGNGNSFSETYTYTDAQGNDVDGCITAINSMRMTWNDKDQLQQVDLGGGGTAYYVYDAAGQRVRKVIESQNGTRQHERIYLGGFEIYREYNNGGTSVALERETLHIMDDKQRIALVETRTQGDDGSAAQLIRYQLSNHLGSASLELDDGTQLISYEEYFPYGTTAFQAGRSAAEVSLKRYRYTAMERDEETGFAYHGARYYAAWLGRWTSCDPRALVDGNNTYDYVGSNPIAFIDPNGTNRKQLWLGEQKKFQITPVATRTGRGITKLQHKALKGIDHAFGSGKGMDWGHPANQTHGTTRAGQSPPLRPQPASENRSSNADKLAKQRAKARGDFVRDAKGVDTTVKEGTRFKQPAPQPFEKTMADYANAIERANPPVTTPRAAVTHAVTPGPNPNQLELPFGEPVKSAPPKSFGGGLSTGAKTFGIAAGVGVAGEIIKDLHEGHPGKAATTAGVAGATTFVLTKVPAAVPLVIMGSTISAYDENVQEHANSAGEFIDPGDHTIIGGVAAASWATGESVYKGTFKPVGTAIGEGAAVLYIRATSDEYTLKPWKTQLWSDFWDLF